MSAHTYSIHIASRGKAIVDVQDFQIVENHVTMLFGESGIGKSLIAKAIYGLLDPQQLSVKINDKPYDCYLHGNDVKEIQESSFFVFQEPSSHLNPLLTLDTQLKEGSLSSAPDETVTLRRLWNEASPENIQNLLEIYPKPNRPSGGEKQRMLLVMAFKKIDLVSPMRNRARNTMFVFDEPTGSLDNKYRDVFLSLLFKKFHEAHFTAILITHDYSMISEVHRSHNKLMGKISFKELFLRENKLAVRDFHPATYMSWLEGQRRQVKLQARKPDPLLTVESGIEVFGRTLVISKDEAGKQVSPMMILAGTSAYLKAPSGTGKTTLVKAMMGLVPCTRLKLNLGGTTLTEKTPSGIWQRTIWGEKIVLVFQHADEALNAHSTVKETFLGLPSKKRITTASIMETLAELFDSEVDEAFLNRKVRTLSGGQKQKLNLLRGLYLDTDILILDEPLNGLDFESTTKVISMIQNRQREGKGLLLISHNEEIIDTQIKKDHIYYLTAQAMAIG
jgi:ABC-type dipeptide/oligopeptide/nickel transport system ATPase subunit